jgi:hypothetical protein
MSRREGLGTPILAREKLLGGSIDYLGSRFRSFEINELELVSLNFTSWNQVTGWLRTVGELRRAA